VERKSGISIHGWLNVALHGNPSFSSGTIDIGRYRNGFAEVELREPALPLEIGQRRADARSSEASRAPRRPWQ
jgi:hypothetical protein